MLNNGVVLMSSAWLYSFFERIRKVNGYLIIVLALLIAFWLIVYLTLNYLIKGSLMATLLAILLLIKIIKDHNKSIKGLDNEKTRSRRN